MSFSPYPGSRQGVVSVFFKAVEFRHFRNYETLFLDLVRGVNLLIGGNAQGKSNFLEALGVLALGRSLRTQRDGELVLWGKNGYFLRGIVEGRSGEHIIEVGFQKDLGKHVRIDGVKHSGPSGLVGIVSFSPEDMSVVKGPPSERRRFMDIALAQLRPSYRYQLIRYFRILTQRNAVLRRIREHMDTPRSLEPWDEQLVRLGSWIWDCRRAFLEQLAKVASSVHMELSGADLVLRYNPLPGAEPPLGDSAKGLAESLRRLLSAHREDEILRATSLFGPHRDEINLEVGGRDIRTFGSQGQQRSVVLALKLAEATLFREILRDEPVLLFDDVFSEFDEKRRKLLWNVMAKPEQVFVATAEWIDFPQGWKEGLSIIRINSGRAERGGIWRNDSVQS